MQLGGIEGNEVGALMSYMWHRIQRENPQPRWGKAFGESFSQGSPVSLKAPPGNPGLKSITPLA